MALKINSKLIVVYILLWTSLLYAHLIFNNKLDSYWTEKGYGHDERLIVRCYCPLHIIIFFYTKYASDFFLVYTKNTNLYQATTLIKDVSKI